MALPDSRTGHIADGSADGIGDARDAVAAVIVEGQLPPIGAGNGRDVDAAPGIRDGIVVSIELLRHGQER